MATEIDPEVLKNVHPRWSREGMFWGPTCPEDAAHGGLIDIQGSDTWYCRHSAHTGRQTYSYEELVALEIRRITADAAAETEHPQQSLPQAKE